jgi:hypothetical protein
MSQNHILKSLSDFPVEMESARVEFHKIGQYLDCFRSIRINLELHSNCVEMLNNNRSSLKISKDVVVSLDIIDTLLCDIDRMEIPESEGLNKELTLIEFFKEPVLDILLFQTHPPIFLTRH